MKTIQNNALWIPRILLMVVFLLFYIIGTYMPWSGVLFFLVLSLTLLGFFVLTFFQPVISGVFYVLLFVFSVKFGFWAEFYRDEYFFHSITGSAGVISLSLLLITGLLLIFLKDNKDQS